MIDEEIVNDRSNSTLIMNNSNVIIYVQQSVSC